MTTTPDDHRQAAEADPQAADTETLATDADPQTRPAGPPPGDED